MTEEGAGDLNRKLYGRPRIPGSHRRVFLAFLAVPAGAPGLSVDELSRVAGMSRSGALAVMMRMDDRGWLDRQRTSFGQPAFSYYLTRNGRSCVTQLAGLPAAMTAGSGD